MKASQTDKARTQAEKLQAKIDAAKRKVQEKEDELARKLQSAKDEGNQKIAMLEMQKATATAESKAALDRRLADVRSDYERRTRRLQEVLNCREPAHAQWVSREIQSGTHGCAPRPLFVRIRHGLTTTIDYNRAADDEVVGVYRGRRHSHLSLPADSAAVLWCHRVVSGARDYVLSPVSAACTAERPRGAERAHDARADGARGARAARLLGSVAVSQLIAFGIGRQMLLDP